MTDVVNDNCYYYALSREQELLTLQFSVAVRYRQKHIGLMLCFWYKVIHYQMIRFTVKIDVRIVITFNNNFDLALFRIETIFHLVNIEKIETNLVSHLLE